MVIDFNRPNGTPSTGNAGRSGVASANEPPSSIRNNPPANPATPQALPADGKDNVQLSAEAQQLKNISEKLKDTPTVDKERVARLKQAIAEGTYTPDSLRVAAKLLQLES